MQVGDWIQALQLRGRLLIEAELMPRFQALAQREQKMVLTAAIIVPLIILIFGVLLPIHDARKLQSDQVALLARQAVEAGQLAQLIGLGAGKQFSGSLLSSVDKTAVGSGVKKYMTHIRPQPEANGSQRLTLQLRDAPYQEAVNFLLKLNELGMAMESVQIRAAKTSGLVNLQATIKG